MSPLSDGMTLVEPTLSECLKVDTDPPKQMLIYVCPTPGCPDFYGATDFRPDRSPIDQLQDRRSSNDGTVSKSFSRIECPLCRINGSKVDRVPYVVTAVVPLSATLGRE